MLGISFMICVGQENSNLIAPAGTVRQRQRMTTRMSLNERGHPAASETLHRRVTFRVDQTVKVDSA